MRDLSFFPGCMCPLTKKPAPPIKTGLEPPLAAGFQQLQLSDHVLWFSVVTLFERLGSWHQKIVSFSQPNLSVVDTWTQQNWDGKLKNNKVNCGSELNPNGVGRNTKETHSSNPSNVLSNKTYIDPRSQVFFYILHKSGFFVLVHVWCHKLLVTYI